MNNERELYFEDFKSGDSLQPAALEVLEVLIVEFGRFTIPKCSILICRRPNKRFTGAS